MSFFVFFDFFNEYFSVALGGRQSIFSKCVVSVLLDSLMSELQENMKGRNKK